MTFVPLFTCMVIRATILGTLCIAWPFYRQICLHTSCGNSNRVETQPVLKQYRWPSLYLFIWDFTYMELNIGHFSLPSSLVFLYANLLFASIYSCSLSIAYNKGRLYLITISGQGVCVTMGGRGSRIIQNCVTTFMHDLILKWSSL